VKSVDRASRLNRLGTALPLLQSSDVPPPSRLRLLRAVAALLTTAGAINACAAPADPSGGAVTSRPAVVAPPVDAPRLDTEIEQAMRDASIPGAIVGISSPGGDYVRAFGMADKATKLEMRPDYYTRIGSVTKTFTVTAILQLVDKRKVELDDPISRYVSGVPSGDRITLRELAQMRSGLVTFDDVPEFADSYLADPSCMRPAQPSRTRSPA
jgi:D-alanyl-D-alanine carboxypeptidase